MKENLDIIFFCAAISFMIFTVDKLNERDITS